MGKAIQSYVPVELRAKLYLILAFVSVLLFFVSVWQVKPVIVDVFSPLGLASYLPPAYWLALAILVLDSILVFLDGELKKDAIFLTILAVLGLFVFGTGVFVYSNALDPSVYHPTSEVNLLLADRHVDIGITAPGYLPNYRTWPAVHFTSASILEISGISTGTMVKYFPLFWMLFFVFLSYAVGKRFELSSNRCFLISFLAIASWLAPLAAGYKAHSLAMILYISLLLLLVIPRKTVAEVVLATILFSTLVFTHAFATLPTLAAIIVLAIYRRNPSLIALFIVIFLSWYLNVAFIAMEHGIRAFWTIPFKELFMVAEESRYQLPSVMARAVNRYAELASLALYVFLVAGSFIVLLRRKIAENYRKYAITAFVWLFGVAILIALNYGGEGSYRLYLFCLLPSACIIALLISKKLLLIPVMCLMVALFPFSNHRVDAAYRQVRTTELKGSEFFAMNIQPWHSYYYGGDPALVNYYQPTFYEDDAIAMFAPSWLPAKMPGDVDLSYIDTHCQYVLISRDGTDHVEFGWGVDPYTEWPEKSEVGRRSDRLYDNGDFQIYWNSFKHLWNPPVVAELEE